MQQSRLRIPVPSVLQAGLPLQFLLWNIREIRQGLQAGADSFLHWQEFLYSGRCLAEDTKNYHAWAHRAAIAEAFDSWERELPIITRMLREDVRNNSAWNHRYLTVQHLLSRSAARWHLHSIAGVIPPARTRRHSCSLQMYAFLFRGICSQRGRAGMG